MAMVKISQTLHHTFLSADLKEVSALVASAINIPEVLLGTGRHEFYLNLHQIIESGKLNTLAQPWSIMSTCFSKVSVCLFLLRIIEHQNRNWDFFLWSLISLVVAVDCASSISILLQCQPLEKLWNPTVSGTCWSQYARNAMGFFQGSESPIPNLYRMLLTRPSLFYSCGFCHRRISYLDFERSKDEQEIEGGTVHDPWTWVVVSLSSTPNGSQIKRMMVARESVLLFALTRCHNCQGEPIPHSILQI
jgi:hypothetical protein